MTLNLWLKILLEIIKPSSLSWWVIGIPVTVTVIAWIYFRLTPPVPTGAWHKLGSRWQKLGFILIISSLSSYVVFGYFSKKYDVEFPKRLYTKLKKPMDLRDKKVDIRDLCEKLDKDFLADFIKDMATKLPREKRQELIAAYCAAKFNKNITIYYDILSWPDSKLEKYKKNNKGKVPLESENGLKYDSEQTKLCNNGNFLELHKKLNKRQWTYILEKFLTPLEKDDLTNVIENMLDYRSESSDSLVDLLADKAFEYNEPKKIAWYAGVEASNNVIYFVITYIRWLRDLIWAIIYLVIGITFIQLGTKIVSEPKLFRV